MAESKIVPMKRSDSSSFLPPNLSVVLLGNSWSPKEAVRNLLLGETEFSLDTIDECVKYRGTFKNKPVTVIYTPDHLLYKSSEPEQIQEIKDLSDSGPRVFLLHLDPEYFTEEEKTRLESVLESLSEEAFQQSLILMSRSPRETLESKKKYMTVSHVKDLIIRCRYRYLWMDETELYTWMGHTVFDPFGRSRKDLFSRISDLLKENPGLDPEELQKKWDGKSLRISLIGKTGTGKSSSGNTILGEKRFSTKPSRSAVIKVCQKEETRADGRCVVVVDTPGLFDKPLSHSEVEVERLRCVSLLDPGPHVFLLVLEPGRFTEEDIKTVELIKEWFGEGVRRFMIILFTHGDKLEDNNKTIHDFIKDSTEPFEQLLWDCGDRYHVFNNNENNRDQVKELLQIIDLMVIENKGECHTIDMLPQAEANTMWQMVKKKTWEMSEKWRKALLGVLTDQSYCETNDPESLK